MTMRLQTFEDNVVWTMQKELQGSCHQLWQQVDLECLDLSFSKTQQHQRVLILCSNILNFRLQGHQKAVTSHKIYVQESTVWHHMKLRPWKEIDDQALYYKYIHHKDLKKLGKVCLGFRWYNIYHFQKIFVGKFSCFRSYNDRLDFRWNIHWNR